MLTVVDPPVHSPEADILNGSEIKHKVHKSLSVFLGYLGTGDEKLGSGLDYPVKKAVFGILLIDAYHLPLIYGSVANRSRHVHSAFDGSLRIYTRDIVLDQTAFDLQGQSVRQCFCAFIKGHTIEFLSLSAHKATVSGESNQYS